MPVVTLKAPLPVMRQVLIAAGSVLLLGLALSLVHPWFIGLVWLAAGMLVMAGITGFCPMARLLACMPWNKVSSASCNAASRHSPS